MKGVTDRFLVIPDVILSPQLVLLRFLEPGNFVLVNLLLLYVVGFVGLNQFRKKYQIGLAIFSVLFLLYNFNGHIVAHIAIGHATWVAYFLLPFFILLVLELFEKEAGWDWILKFVILQIVIFLQGGYHFFVWTLTFLVLLGLFTPQIRKTIFLAAVTSVLGCAFRILPAVLVTDDLVLEYLGGFTTLDELLKGFVVLVEPAKVLELVSPLNPYVGWWEFDYYLGWVGVILIAGVFFLSWRNKTTISPTFNKLLAPSLIFLVLSIGRLYKPIFMLQIPILNGERVGSRFLILPVLFLLFAAAMYGQRLIDEKRFGTAHKVAFVCLFFILFNDLQQHMELWSVAQLERIIAPDAINPSNYLLNNRPDPVYLTLLIASGVVSLLTLLGLVWASRRIRRAATAR